MRSGRMARRLVATAGMGAIIAMGVLSACAQEKKRRHRRRPPRHEDGHGDGRRRRPRLLRRRRRRRGEVDQPDRRQPVLASGQGARTADAGSRQRPGNK